MEPGPDWKENFLYNFPMVFRFHLGLVQGAAPNTTSTAPRTSRAKAVRKQSDMELQSSAVTFGSSTRPRSST